MCTLHVMECKGSFFVIKFEEAQRNDPNQYPEQKKIKILPKRVNNLFKFSAQDSDLEYGIWQRKISQVSSDSKPPLVVAALDLIRFWVLLIYLPQKPNTHSCMFRTCCPAVWPILNMTLPRSRFQ